MLFAARLVWVVNLLDKKDYWGVAATAQAVAFSDMVGRRK